MCVEVLCNTIYVPVTYAPTSSLLILNVLLMVFRSVHGVRPAAALRTTWLMRLPQAATNYISVFVAP